jgi:N-acylneuraminate cytidylyltransferase
MVYRHVLESLGACAPPGFCALYATALLVTPADLREAAEKLEAGADVVMSVCEFPLHPFKALERGEDGFYKMIHPAECLMRSQTYPRYVASNGTFYWFRTEAFLRGPTYYPEKLAVHVLPYARAVDIDTAEEFEIAELFKRHQLSGAPAL